MDGLGKHLLGELDASGKLPAEADSSSRIEMPGNGTKTELAGSRVSVEMVMQLLSTELPLWRWTLEYRVFQRRHRLHHTPQRVTSAYRTTMTGEENEWETGTAAQTADSDGEKDWKISAYPAYF